MLKQMYIDLVKRPNPLIIRWMRKIGRKRYGTIPWGPGVFLILILMGASTVGIGMLLRMEHNFNLQMATAYQTAIAVNPNGGYSKPEFMNVIPLSFAWAFVELTLLTAIALSLATCFSESNLRHKIGGKMLMELYLTRMTVRRLYTTMYRSAIYELTLYAFPIIICMSLIVLAMFLLAMRGTEFWVDFMLKEGSIRIDALLIGSLISFILTIRFIVDCQCHAVAGWFYGLKSRAYPFGFFKALGRCLMEIPAGLALWFLIGLLFLDIFHDTSVILPYITMGSWALLIAKVKRLSREHRHLIRPLKRSIYQLAIVVMAFSIVLVLLRAGSFHVPVVNIAAFIAMGPAWAYKIWLSINLNLRLLYEWPVIGGHRFEGALIDN